MVSLNPHTNMIDRKDKNLRGTRAKFLRRHVAKCNEFSPGLNYKKVKKEWRRLPFVEGVRFLAALMMHAQMRAK